MGDVRVGICLQFFSAKGCGITVGIKKEVLLNAVLEVGRVSVLCCLVEVHVRVRKSCSAQRDYTQDSEASMSFFPLDILFGLVLRK